MHAYTMYDVHVKLPSGLEAATAVPGGRGCRTATLFWKVNLAVSSIQKTSKNAIPLVLGSRHLFRVSGVDSPNNNLPSVVRPLSAGRVRGMNLHTGLQHVHIRVHKDL